MYTYMYEIVHIVNYIIHYMCDVHTYMWPHIYICIIRKRFISLKMIEFTLYYLRFCDSQNTDCLTSRSDLSMQVWMLHVQRWYTLACNALPSQTTKFQYLGTIAMYQNIVSYFFTPEIWTASSLHTFSATCSTLKPSTWTESVTIHVPLI